MIRVLDLQRLINYDCPFSDFKCPANALDVQRENTSDRWKGEIVEEPTWSLFQKKLTIVQKTSQNKKSI